MIATATTTTTATPDDAQDSEKGWPSQNKRNVPSINDNTVIILKGKSSRNVRAEATQKYNLTFLLRDKIGFNLFMEHLFFEFSPELLLGYLELSQFYNKYNEKHTDRYETCSLLPKSKIVFDESLPIKRKLQMLNEKYIVKDGPFELNLQAAIKKNFLDKLCLFLNDKADSGPLFDALLSILHRLLDQIHYLMRDSFNRFRQTESYRQYVKFNKGELTSNKEKDVK
ncbi:hypothetical protein RFI_07927 [Reticulomyxa filosa]|uniref:RGS domain-containing protein n=1 Tax=Reticulomyxa filosa TaxID=46433 RepID=X6NT56_RETFI|nr:hypothetical protein RFI_07927 [Reticulomyxa filosa]|eukprot:ETO29196.1 hypothetical protein RFI_07927 [Reticulomyxa filosa]